MPIKIGLWMTGKGLFGQMRLKSTDFSLMEGSGYGRDQGKGFWWIERYRGLSSLVVDHS